jgi:GntR family transcriptional regulator
MPDPACRGIAEDLRQKIDSGELGHGDQLPTEPELMDQYGASRNTARDAVRWLVTHRLAETRPGKGTFAVAALDPYVTRLTGDLTADGNDEGPVSRAGVEAKLRKLTASEPCVGIQRASGLIESELWLAEGSTVVSRHQQRYIDGTPWSLRTSFYPISLVERGALKLIEAPNIDEGTVAYLSTRLGLRQAGYRDKVTARPAGVNETAFFRLPNDGRIAVFEIRRTAFDEQGQPFRLTVTVSPADRNQFAFNVGKVPEKVISSTVRRAAGTPQPKIAALEGGGQAVPAADPAAEASGPCR